MPFLAIVEFDPDRFAPGAGENVGKVGHGFFRREGTLEGAADVDLPGDVPGQSLEAIVPARGDGPDRLLELWLGNTWRLAAGPADDEMHAGDPAFGEGRVIGRDAAVIDGLQIGADPLADVGIIFLA